LKNSVSFRYGVCMYKCSSINDSKYQTHIASNSGIPGISASFWYRNPGIDILLISLTKCIANLVSSAEVEIDLQLSMLSKLARAIKKEMNSKISSKSGTTKDAGSIFCFSFVSLNIVSFVLVPRFLKYISYRFVSEKYC
jgi:hypothetical protein